MKTAISLSDSLFQQAEAIRRRLKQTRSQFYAQALTAWVGRFDVAAITRAMDRVSEKVEGRGEDWVTGAGEQTLRDTQW